MSAVRMYGVGVCTPTRTPTSSEFASDSGMFGYVRRSTEWALACENDASTGGRRTAANGLPITGGQVVAGSNPVSPTIIRAGHGVFVAPLGELGSRIDTSFDTSSPGPRRIAVGPLCNHPGHERTPGVQHRGFSVRGWGSVARVARPGVPVPPAPRVQRHGRHTSPPG
jgi:hypothetical protein